MRYTNILIICLYKFYNNNSHDSLISSYYTNGMQGKDLIVALLMKCEVIECLSGNRLKHVSSYYFFKFKYYI